MRFRASVLLLPLALCTAQRALAQQPDVQAEAEDLFRKGRVAQEEGHCRRALAFFHKSQELVPGRGKELNIAICEEKLGLLATAITHFREVLPKFANDPDRAKYVRDRIEALEPRLSYLRIDLDQASGALPGVIVTYDNAPMAPAALGTDILVDPGKHEIAIRAPERHDRRYLVTIEERKKIVFPLEAGPAVSQDPQREPTKPAAEKMVIEVLGKPRSPVPGVIMGVAGLGALGAGAGLFALSKRKRNDTFDLAGSIAKRNGNCVSAPIDKSCSDVRNLAKQSDNLHNIAIGSFVGAGALAIGTLTYLLIPPPREKKEVLQSGKLQVTPMLDTKQGGMIFYGAF